MTMPERPIAPTPESEADLDARWAEQERLRKVAAAGTAVPALDRALFEALNSLTLPELPEDFAASVADTAEGLADARRRVARFRALSLRLFSLLYLPAIAAVVALFAGDLPAIWARSAPEQRTPMLWAATLAVLWSIVIVTERLRWSDRAVPPPP
jgi:hypothetical protein